MIGYSDDFFASDIDNYGRFEYTITDEAE